MKIEKPEEHDALPEDDNFSTIGQFYEAIEEGLVRLCRELGDENVFTGEKTRQITDALYYGGGRIVAVFDLDSALATLEEIVSENIDSLTWKKTEVIETEETYALCRCGQSSTKPFCDRTHARIGFTE